MMRTGFLLSCFCFLVFLNCSEEDDMSPNTAAWCEEPISLDGCRGLSEDQWDSMDEFRNTLIGDWKIVASGAANRSFGVECNILEEEFRFSFSEDGIFEYQFFDGQMGSSNYSVVINPCLVFPCSYSILYEDNTIGYRPSFHNFCSDGLAWFDNRPADGEMAVYQKQ